jgi:hypothetical protein
MMTQKQKIHDTLHDGIMNFTEKGQKKTRVSDPDPYPD